MVKSTKKPAAKKAAKKTTKKAAAKKAAKKPSPLKGTKKPSPLKGRRTATVKWQEHSTTNGVKVLHREEGGRTIIRVEAPEVGIDLPALLAQIAAGGGTPGTAFASDGLAADDDDGGDLDDKPYRLFVNISGQACTGKTTLAYWLASKLGTLGASITVEDGEDDSDDVTRNNKLAAMWKRANDEGLKLFEKQGIEITTTMLPARAQPKPREPLPLRAFDAFVDVLNQLKAGSSIVIAGEQGSGKTTLANRIGTHVGIVADFPVILVDGDDINEKNPDALTIREWNTRDEPFDGTELIGERGAPFVRDADLVIGIGAGGKIAHLIKNRVSEPFSFEL